MSAKVKNRRKFHRINFDGKVNLKFVDESSYCCQIQNLSLTGMFVTGNFKQLEAKHCIVELFNKETTGNKYLQASCKVIWSSDEEVRLKFTGMTFEDYMLLVATLINNANQPAIILREFPKDCPFEITSVNIS